MPAPAPQRPAIAVEEYCLELSDDEVRQISPLVETLEKCSFDFLQLSVGNSSMLWNIRPGGMRFTGGAAR